MAEYTPEPWEWDSDNRQILAGLVNPDQPKCGREIICKFYPSGEANARRIVACVNACRLYSTEDLESIAAAGGIAAVEF